MNGTKKVVGISQRRTRDGALFQCALPLHFRAGRIASLFALSGADREALIQDLDTCVAPLGYVDADRIEASFLSHLPP